MSANVPREMATNGLLKAMQVRKMNVLNTIVIELD